MASQHPHHPVRNPEEAQKRRGPWTGQEDSKLMQLIRDEKQLNWVIISQKLGTRSAKQCRERYHQNLNPALCHDPITEVEGRFIMQFVQTHGKKWAEIARHLEHRSDNTVKNWWNGNHNREAKRQQRRLRRTSPVEHGSPQQQQPLPDFRPSRPARLELSGLHEGRPHMAAPLTPPAHTPTSDTYSPRYHETAHHWTYYQYSTSPYQHARRDPPRFGPQQSINGAPPYSSMYHASTQTTAQRGSPPSLPPLQDVVPGHYTDGQRHSVEDQRSPQHYRGDDVPRSQQHDNRLVQDRWRDEHTHRGDGFLWPSSQHAPPHGHGLITAPSSTAPNSPAQPSPTTTTATRSPSDSPVIESPETRELSLELKREDSHRTSRISTIRSLLN